MGQKILTGVGLLAIAMVLLYFGGTVVSLTVLLCMCAAIYEEDKALTQAGHDIVTWPQWLCLIAGVPLVMMKGDGMVLLLLVICTFICTIQVIFRKEPKLYDLCLSILPMISIVLPGLSIMAMAHIQPKGLSTTLLLMTVLVPVGCDSLAYFIGSQIRGPKLCPAVSPNKTISGAIGGMAGALLVVLLIGLIVPGFCQPETVALLPKWWHLLLLGVLGGIACQTGDLFASLVKRHCGIKDFSELFPGHGGMLDRLDSILFMAIVVYAYWLLTV